MKSYIKLEGMLRMPNERIEEILSQTAEREAVKGKMQHTVE